MLGQAITVEYFDQNESFKDTLPRSGHLVREVSLAEGGSEWYLLELDEGFDYQHKVAEPYVFTLLHINHLLIKSRWKGTAIGEDQPTSVFVLLVPDPAILSKENVSMSDFMHVCWGMAHTTE